MTFSISSKHKLLISFSELIGLILSFLPTIWIVMNGGIIEDTFIDIAFRTLKLALSLRSINIILGTLSLTLIFTFTVFFQFFIWKKRHKFNFNTEKWVIFRVLIGVYIGYVLGEILFFILLNSIFYRNAFVTIPFLFGIALMIGVLGLIFGNIELTPILISFFSNSEKTQQPATSRLRLIETIAKIILFLLIALLLIIPNIVPLLSNLPKPPSDPEEDYIDKNELFDVNVIKVEHILPSNISEMIQSENADGKWYTYIYLPKVRSLQNLQFPVALYLHGFTGIDIAFYQSSMKALAQRGVIGIFSQYATFINLQGDDANAKFDHPSENPELYVRYAMEWSGINQAISALNLNTNTIGSQTMLGTLGSNYSIDFSRLMIIGHSMGGGMVPYIATKSLEQGWGSNELILDMEAPWYSSSWKGYEADYQIFPSYTLLNIATYEDDHAVSQCIGMDFYEKIRFSNGTMISDEQTNFIYIYSDFYGFPRLLASHYLPVDALDDSLHQYGYKKRIKAMAFYLFESAQGRSDQLDDAYEFFLGSEVANMGNWSDGKPINEAYVTKDPYGIRGETSLVNQLQDTSDELCKILVLG